MRVMLKSLQSCLLALVLAAGACDAQPIEPPTGALAIGVRSKARPFAYKLPDGVIDSDATSGPLSRAGYSGYMVRICDAALAEMIVNPEVSGGLNMDQVTIYDIDTGLWHGQRGQNKDNEPEDPATARFEKLGISFDILCDPATITNQRRGVIVSPPVFLTGISYLTLRNTGMPTDPCGDKDVSDSPEKEQAVAKAVTEAESKDSVERKDKRALIGLVAGTTSKDRGIQALIDAREMPQREAKLVDELRNPSVSACKESDEAKKDSKPSGDATAAKPEKVLVQTYRNHAIAAQQFCAGKSFHYYVGDLEIIRSYAGAIPGCDIENGVVTYTNDRYAVFGMAVGCRPPLAETVPDPLADCDTERALRVAKFFSILTQKVIFNPSVLDKAYDDTFPGQVQSKKLKLFYWSIRGERLPELPSDSGSPSEAIQKQTD